MGYHWPPHRPGVLMYSHVSHSRESVHHKFTRKKERFLFPVGIHDVMAVLVQTMSLTGSWRCTAYAACSAQVFSLISTNRPLNRLPRGTWRVQLSRSCRGHMSAPPAPLCVHGIAASKVVISSFLSLHSAAAQQAMQS